MVPEQLQLSLPCEHKNTVFSLDPSTPWRVRCRDCGAVAHLVRFGRPLWPRRLALILGGKERS